MRYWFDTEFIEDGKTIDLISIGIVAEDGREYYAINRDCDFKKAGQWVKDNVLSQLPARSVNPQTSSPTEREGMRLWKKRETITAEVADFLGCFGEGAKPEFWAYYADYDWVVFCQLFGTMMDLPKGFPMYCRDIKQECDRLGNPELPEQSQGIHNALEDARWNRKAWEFLQQISNS